MKKSIRPTEVLRQRHRFTMVELMVAMSVLVIMMGFLFQFVIGAQRIWNASSNTADAFAQAQVALDVIEQDLSNSRQLYELPVYYKSENVSGKNTTKEAAFCLPTFSEENENVALVGYYYIRGNADSYRKGNGDFRQGYNKLYRYLDSERKCPFIGQNREDYSFGNDFFTTNPPDWTTGKKSSKIYDSSTFDENSLKNNYDLLADHVLNFKIQFLERLKDGSFSQPMEGTNPNQDYCKWKDNQNKRAVKVTLTIYNEDALPKDFDGLSAAEQETALFNAARTFTRIIFL